MNPVILEGAHVRLEPMVAGHHEGLTAAAMDPGIWEFMRDIVRSAGEMSTYMEAAMRMRDEGTAMPFVTVERASGAIVGSTRFANFDRANNRVEIGWTWLAQTARRTAINTEAKLLMMTHAFEELGCVRVEFKTDALNERSRAAIKRLGASEEGFCASTFSSGADGTAIPFITVFSTTNGRPFGCGWKRCCGADSPPIHQCQTAKSLSIDGTTCPKSACRQRSSAA